MVVEKDFSISVMSSSASASASWIVSLTEDNLLTYFPNAVDLPYNFSSSASSSSSSGRSSTGSSSSGRSGGGIRAYWTLPHRKNQHKTSPDWMIKFYAPWCGHCRNFAPTYVELASLVHRLQRTSDTNLDPNSSDTNLDRDHNNNNNSQIKLKAYNVSDVRIAEMDCTRYYDLCNTFNITGYPTVRYFNADITKSITFAKARSVENLLDFIHHSKLAMHPHLQLENSLLLLKDYRIDNIHFRPSSKQLQGSAWFSSPFQYYLVVFTCVVTLLCLIGSAIRKQKSRHDYDEEYDLPPKAKPTRKEKLRLNSPEDNLQLDLERNQVILDHNHASTSSPTTVLPRKHHHHHHEHEVTELGSDSPMEGEVTSTLMRVPISFLSRDKKE